MTRDWVRLVNDGVVEPITEEASRPLTRDALVGEVQARLGTDAPAGDDAYVEPLDLFLDAVEREADLTILGRWLTRRFLLRLLTVRHQLADYVHEDPGVVDEPVVEPVFVTGAPRTGTTVLFNLLAADPALRSPLGWELLWPLPPPTGPDEARIELAEAELRMLARVAPGIDSIHEYGARKPKECLSAMSFELRSEELTARYRVPTYASWLAACDMGPAYRCHRLVLQVLQRRTAPASWVLKSPVHLRSLPTLLATYPDARVIVTHRDPVAVLASVTSLIATLRRVHSDAVDVAEIARDHADRYHADLDALVDLDDPRLVHVRYDDLVADPLAVVKGLVPVSTEAETAMRTVLASSHAGGHDYSFDDLGLDLDEQRARFARYCEAFGVSSR